MHWHDHPIIDTNDNIRESIGGGKMKGFDRITFDPHIMGGQACIRGMRIPVSLVVNLVANGMTAEEIIKEYPDLEPEDIKASCKH